MRFVPNKRVAIYCAIPIMLICVVCVLFYMSGLSETVGGQRFRAFFGSAQASYDLGLRYREGQDVAQDFPEAAAWFTKGAHRGSAPAQYALGILYEFGLGVPQSDEEARRYIEQAAQQNYAPAFTKIGSMVEEDDPGSDIAMEFWKRAAALRDPWGEYLLGAAYLQRGEQGDENLAKAIYWLERARHDGVEVLKGLSSAIIAQIPDKDKDRVQAKVCEWLDGKIEP